MGVDSIEVRDNYETVLNDIKASVALIQTDMDIIKADLTVIKDNTKKEP